MFRVFRLSAAVCLALSAAIAVMAVAVLSGFSNGGGKSYKAKPDSSTRQIPILMYHSVVKDGECCGHGHCHHDEE